MISPIIVYIAMSAAVISPSQDKARHRSGSHCTEATLYQLWRNPLPFRGRRVCLSGYFGQLIPYGEAAPELYATRQDAADARSDQHVVLGIPFTIWLQERLSHYSLRDLRVMGIFKLELPCHPVTDSSPQETICSSPPAMRIANATLVFDNGDRIRCSDELGFANRHSHFHYSCR